MSCRVLKLARGAYYRWVQQPVGKAEALRNRRVAALQAAHGDNPEFGYRLLADGASMAGTPMADRAAWRLCHRAGIVSVTVKTRRKKNKKPGPAVCDDLVQRNFTASGPNQLWLSEITEHRAGEEKLYLCAAKDVWDKRIVGYSLSDRMKAGPAVDAMNNAAARRGVVTRCVVHTDRGSQFRSKKFQRALEVRGLVASMG